MGTIIWIIGLIVCAFILLRFISFVRATDNAQKNVTSLQNHDIHAGYLVSKYNVKKFEAQTESIVAKSNAVSAAANLQATQKTAVPIATIAGEVALENAAFEKKVNELRLKWEHEEHEIEHEIKLAVGKKSVESGLTPENYQLVAVAKATSDIEIDKHRQLKQIDADAALLEQMNTIQAIITFKNIKFNEFDEVRHRINLLIEEEDRIENSHASALVKGQKLELIEHSKGMYKEVLNGLKNRLLEAGNGEELSGMESFFTQSGGFGTNNAANDQDPISALVVRNGGGDSNT